MATPFVQITPFTTFKFKKVAPSPSIPFNYLASSFIAFTFIVVVASPQITAIIKVVSSSSSNSFKEDFTAAVVAVTTVTARTVTCTAASRKGC